MSNEAKEGGNVTRPTDGRTQEKTVGSSATIDTDDLVILYQPFYNLRSGRLQGLEALVRRHCDGSARPALPADFFDGATAAGEMRAIDLRVLDDALAELARWRDEGQARDLILAVNLSWDSAIDPDTLAEVRQALARHAVPGDRLLVDITTDILRRLLADESDPLHRPDFLKEQEITLCLDGFTADDLDILDAAAAVPVDIIKLAPRQVSVSTPQERHRLAEIAGAIQTVGLPTVAAGVETEDHLTLVRELGFEWAQGFLLGAPTDAAGALAHHTLLFP